MTYLNLIEITDIVSWSPLIVMSFTGQSRVTETVSSREDPEFVYQRTPTLHPLLQTEENIPGNMTCLASSHYSGLRLESQVVSLIYFSNLASFE